MSVPYKLISAAFLLAASSQASAANWFNIGKNVHGSVTYIDLDSARANGTIIVVWQRVDHSVDATVGHRESLQQWSYDCSRRTSRLLSYVNYRADRTIVASHTVNQYLQEDRPVVPDSMGEAVFDVVCSRRD